MTPRGFRLRVAVLVALAALGLAWPLLGAVLPDLDGALAPSGASALGLVAAVGGALSRVAYVLLAPGIAAAIAVDLAVRTTRASPRVSVPPCAPSSSQR